jgi:hypothetical protein
MADVAHGTGENVNGSPIDKFLTPEAMLTPGAAGGVVMLIANVVSHNFGLSPLYTSYLGLLLSFLFGLLVLASVRVWWTRLIYYVLNSLIIFCVAFGSGNLVAANPPAGTAHAASVIFPSAYAADSPTSDLDQLKAEYSQLNAKYDDELKKLTDLQNRGAAQSEIDSQVSVLQEIQERINANRERQFTEVKKGAVLGGSNSVAPREVFRPWANPFRP